MEAVVHAGRQAQRDVAAVAIALDQRRVAEQVEQGVGKALGLEQLRCRQSRRRRRRCRRRGWSGCRDRRFDRPRAGLQLAGEAVVQAAELAFCAHRTRSRSANSRQMAMERSRTSGCSILLNQPMKRVSNWRGMRLVSRKLRSSWRTMRDKQSANGHGSVKRLG